jgi:hypothetical protein
MTGYAASKARRKADRQLAAINDFVESIRSPNRTHAPSSLQNIRVSSAAANPLSGSQY